MSVWLQDQLSPQWFETGVLHQGSGARAFIRRQPTAFSFPLALESALAEKAGSSAKRGDVSSYGGSDVVGPFKMGCVGSLEVRIR